MIQFSDIVLSQLALHKVGRKHQQEPIGISKELANIENAELQQILLDYFLPSFKLTDYYQFHHLSDLSLNEVYNYCKKIFENPTTLYEQSVNIVRYLYDQSEHPKIKAGEVYVAYFENCIIEDELVDAVGIFKSEEKSTFLEFTEKDMTLEIDCREGILPKKLDKGALIFNVLPEEGYRVLSVDLSSFDAQYWRTDFLGIDAVENNAFYTKTYLSMCKDFCKKVIAKEESVKEQADFINKTVEYFENNDSFELNTFTEEVMPNNNYSERFKAYKDKYEERQGINTDEAFVIAKDTFQNMKKRFRNAIKLDTNFEIKVNNNPEVPKNAERFLEKGFDEKRQMHFYKIYFNQEK